MLTTAHLSKTQFVIFLNYSSGGGKDTLKFDNYQIPINGSSQLICYTGHNGLMDFKVEQVDSPSDKQKREVIILACYSKSYFKELIRKSGAMPLIWSTHLMSPEAYTTHAAISGWLANESPEQIKERAAKAYNKYLKCGIKGARNLLVTGWSFSFDCKPEKRYPILCTKPHHIF